MEDLKPSVVLARAADLIAPEGRWIQGDIAGDSNGWPLRAAVTGADFCAKCWCVFGAIQKAGWLQSRVADKADPGRLHSFHREEQSAGKRVAAALGLEGVIDLLQWNDAPERTQAEVVEALRTASKLAEGEGQ